MGNRTPKYLRTTGTKGIKRISLTIRVSRLASGESKHNPNRAFVSCVGFSKATGMRVYKSYPKLSDACGYGRNPRQAVARALGAAQRKIAARGGTFKGMK